MSTRSISYLVCITALLWLGPVVAGAQDAAEDRAPVNAAVMKLIDRMPTGGGYEWKSTGVPHTIRHDGQVVLSKTTADGTYCSGVTFTVAMEAARRAGLLRDMSFDQVKQLQRQWYGVGQAEAETQCVYALEQHGLGRAVEHDEAHPGDFVQFWRGKSGHSVVFMAWVTDRQGQRIGLTYWSSQTATDGIGQHTEYFRDVPGKKGYVNPERVYIGRMLTPRVEPSDTSAG
jgi:hypothetical protein